MRVLIVAGLIVLGCGGDDGDGGGSGATGSALVCEPGSTQRCVCPSGDGAQACAQDGSGWGSCACGGSGGIGGSNSECVLLKRIADECRVVDCDNETCAGTCIGNCFGMCSSPVGGSCEGICEGTCDGSCDGQCGSSENPMPDLYRCDIGSPTCECDGTTCCCPG